MENGRQVGCSGLGSCPQPHLSGAQPQGLCQTRVQESCPVREAWPRLARIFRVITAHLPESRSGTQGASSSAGP